MKAVYLLNLQKGYIVAMDRAYNDYNLFHEWTQQGVFFVTRKKSNAVYEVTEERDIPQNRNILSDSIITLTGTAGSQCMALLRLVVVWDEEKKREIELLTNHLDFGATTISAIYKDRWQIELFFKALKRNLNLIFDVFDAENLIYQQQHVNLGLFWTVVSLGENKIV